MGVNIFIVETLFAWNVVSSRSPHKPFPWEVHRGIFGLIRGNLQMFVNTHAAAETREDLPFKHSDVECLLEVGFLGNHDHWAC